MSEASASVNSAVDEDAPEAFGWALGAVTRAYRDAADHALSDFESGPRGYQVLAVVGRESPRSQAALAAYLGVDRTAMTYLIDDLESAGLVHRTPDPADRRARLITLTTSGRERLAALDSRLRTSETQLFAALGDDAPALRTLLVRLASQVTDPSVREAICGSED